MPTYPIKTKCLGSELDGSYYRVDFTPLAQDGADTSLYFRATPKTVIKLYFSDDGHGYEVAETYYLKMVSGSGDWDLARKKKNRQGFSMAYFDLPLDLGRASGEPVKGTIEVELDDGQFASLGAIGAAWDLVEQASDKSTSHSAAFPDGWVTVTGNPSLTVGGDTRTLTATVRRNASPTVTWASSDTGVATVNSSTGEVTAVAAGTATITATDSGTGATGSMKVVVGAVAGAGADYTIVVSRMHNTPYRRGSYRVEVTNNTDTTINQYRLALMTREPARANSEYGDSNKKFILTGTARVLVRSSLCVTTRTDKTGTSSPDGVAWTMYEIYDTVDIGPGETNSVDVQGFLVHASHPNTTWTSSDEFKVVEFGITAGLEYVDSAQWHATTSIIT